MTLDEWAQKWRIPSEALADLVTDPGPKLHPDSMSEAAVQANVRMLASDMGWRLWRNNVGVLEDSRGVPVRYGLCNETPAQNSRLKSSDLIGIRPVLVRPDDVGRTIGQFAAVEVKAAGWRRPKGKREKAQGAFLALVRSMGGYGAFSVGDLP